MSVEAVFADKAYCLAELCRIREAWGYRRTFTFKMIEAARKVLAWMQLYGPADIQDMVDATIEELGRREFLCVAGGILRPENSRAILDTPRESVREEVDHADLAVRARGNAATTDGAGVVALAPFSEAPSRRPRG